MTREVERLKGLGPKVIDAKVAGVLAGKVDPESAEFSAGLSRRLQFVVELREQGLWPACERVRMRKSRKA